MPIYEYACKEGHHFEKIESFDAAKIKKCPECGKKAERIISLAAFHLKGSGWYSKDSSGKTAKTEPAKTDKAADKSDKPEKSDKPASKSDAKETKPEKSEKKVETKASKETSSSPH